MKESGLNDVSREVGVPNVKDQDNRSRDVELDRIAARQNRGVIGPLNDLGQDS